MHHNSSLPSLFAPTASTSAIPATPHFTATHPPSSPSPINGDEFELLRTPSAPTTQPLADPGRLFALAHLATIPPPPTPPPPPPSTPRPTGRAWPSGRWPPRSGRPRSPQATRGLRRRALLPSSMTL